MNGIVHPGKGDRLWRGIVIGAPYAWLLLFFIAPFIIVLKISFADPIVAQPPFTNFFDWSANAGHRVLATLDNYRFLLEDNLYIISYLRSIKIALVSTAAVPAAGLSHGLRHRTHTASPGATCCCCWWCCLSGRPSCCASTP